MGDVVTCWAFFFKQPIKKFQFFSLPELRKTQLKKNRGALEAKMFCIYYVVMLVVHTSDIKH